MLSDITSVRLVHSTSIIHDVTSCFLSAMFYLLKFLILKTNMQNPKTAAQEPNLKLDSCR